MECLFITRIKRIAFVTADRIKGLQIGVSDSLPTFKFSMDVCNSYNPPGAAEGTINLACNKAGKYFILRLPTNNPLHVSEVDVYAGTALFCPVA